MFDLEHHRYEGIRETHRNLNIEQGTEYADAADVQKASGEEPHLYRSLAAWLMTSNKFIEAAQKLCQAINNSDVNIDSKWEIAAHALREQAFILSGDRQALCHWLMGHEDNETGASLPPPSELSLVTLHGLRETVKWEVSQADSASSGDSSKFAVYAANSWIAACDKAQNADRLEKLAFRGGVPENVNNLGQRCLKLCSDSLEVCLTVLTNLHKSTGCGVNKGSDEELRLRIESLYVTGVEAPSDQEEFKEGDEKEMKEPDQSVSSFTQWTPPVDFVEQHTKKNNEFQEYMIYVQTSSEIHHLQGKAPTFWNFEEWINLSTAYVAASFEQRAISKAWHFAVTHDPALSPVRFDTVCDMARRISEDRRNACAVVVSSFTANDEPEAISVVVECINGHESTVDWAQTDDLCVLVCNLADNAGQNLGSKKAQRIVANARDCVSLYKETKSAMNLERRVFARRIPEKMAELRSRCLLICKTQLGLCVNMLLLVV